MTDLTDRMRTCAAHLATASVVANPAAIDDAAALLLAAATEIELLTGPIDLGEPMEVIEPAVLGVAKLDPETMKPISPAVWVSGGDTLPVANPYRGPHTCPKCDSRANKTVRKKGKSLWLVCPVCEHAWTR
jgi:hypothetical protein